MYNVLGGVAADARESHLQEDRHDCRHIFKMQRRLEHIIHPLWNIASPLIAQYPERVLDDLRTVVSHSALPEMAELVQIIKNLIVDVASVSSGLQTLSLQADGAVEKYVLNKSLAA